MQHHRVGGRGGGWRCRYGRGVWSKHGKRLEQMQCEDTYAYSSQLDASLVLPGLQDCCILNCVQASYQDSTHSTRTTRGEETGQP